MRMETPRPAARRTSADELRGLGLAADALLRDVPLQDVTVLDLAGGGSGRTISDVRALLAEAAPTRANPLVRALFGLRGLLGRLFRWDAERPDDAARSYIHRLGPELRRRSRVAPGTAEGNFRVLYVLEREALSEVQNATVHAFLSTALVETATGYRLYWAVHVAPRSRLTPLYMALIEPFRRFIVYPAILRQIRRGWQARYPAP